jgi:hypothetical protein
MARLSLCRYVLALSIASQFAFSMMPEADAKTRKPKKETTNVAESKVWVGVYLLRIHQIDLRDNYFTADFYLWFRWKGDDIKPYKTFSLIDAREESKTEPVVNTLADGSYYAYVRIVAQITKFWDLRQYPLDAHELDIRVEEDEDEEDAVRYIADEENSGIDQLMSLMPGWELVDVHAFTETGVYKSNFGDVSLPKGHESRYSRFILRMNYSRQNHLALLKLFGVWVGVGISFVTFFVTPDRIDSRFGVGVGAIFAAVASEYIVAQSLPDTNVITLADKLHLLALAFIFASIVESTVSFRLFQQGRRDQSGRLDTVARWAFPFLFVLLTAAATRFR